MKDSIGWAFAMVIGSDNCVAPSAHYAMPSFRTDRAVMQQAENAVDLTVCDGKERRALQQLLATPGPPKLADHHQPPVVAARVLAL